MANSLELSVISGGKYFRALANRFQVFCEQNSDLSSDQQYLLFLKLYQERFSQDGLEGILSLIEEGISNGAHGEILARFGQAIEASSKTTGEVNPIWDYIVDQKTFDDALRAPGFVWESKLAVLAFKIDQLAVVARQSNSVVPYLRVVLTLDPVIAAERVSEREGRAVSVDEILIRKQRDFARYGELYQIGGQKVLHDHLVQSADVVIDTENTDPNEVAVTILKKYIQILSTLGVWEKTFAHQAIDEIRRALGESQTVA